MRYTKRALTHSCGSMQQGLVFDVLRTCIRTMLKQHTYDLDTPISQHCYIQWGSAFAVLRACIRAMLKQHAYDLGPPIFRPIRRSVQCGRAVNILCV